MAGLKRAVLVYPSGLVAASNVETDLAGLQAVVGGYLEAVALDERTHLYCDEEGKIKGLELNHLATLLVESYRPGWPDVICGPAVVLGSTPSGNETHVPNQVFAWFSELGTEADS